MSSTENRVNTPIYPTPDAKFNEILDVVVDDDFLLNKNVLIYSPDKSASELNMFFQYYKIATGTKGHHNGMGVFFDGPNANANVVNWKKEYRTWQDMETWELREWFSMFYEAWLSQWIDSAQQAPDSFLKLPSIGMINNPKKHMDTIFKHCNLTWNNKDIDKFLDIWYSKQTIITKKFNECKYILNNIVNNNDITWKKLDFIQEAMLQKRLHDCGYKIKCWELNEFPTSTKQLYTLLEKV